MSTEIQAAPGLIQTPIQSFARPGDTTAYTAADLIANSTTAASVVPMAFPVAAQGGLGKIRRARISKSTATLTVAQFKLHLYSAPPICSTNHGDNAAWLTDKAANYLGSLSLAGAMTRAFADGAAGIATPDEGSELVFNIDPVLGATVYGLLAAIGAYTPASAEVFTVALEIAQI